MASTPRPRDTGAPRRRFGGPFGRSCPEIGREAAATLAAMRASPAVYGPLDTGPVLASSSLGVTMQKRSRSIAMVDSSSEGTGSPADRRQARRRQLPFGRGAILLTASSSHVVAVVDLSEGGAYLACRAAVVPGQPIPEAAPDPWRGAGPARRSRSGRDPPRRPRRLPAGHRHSLPGARSRHSRATRPLRRRGPAPGVIIELGGRLRRAPQGIRTAISLPQGSA